MILLDLKQGSEEWLKKRQGCITGTDASVIMGCNPFKNRMFLLKEKLGIVSTKQNEAMRIGSMLEDKARELFIKDTGILVKPAVCLHDDFFYMLASLDGLSECGNFIYEAKCGKSAVEKAKNNEIPRYYYAQMQHCLAVTGAQKAYYHCYYEYDTVVTRSIIIEVIRDNSYINELIKQEAMFFTEMLTSNVHEMLIDEREELKELLNEYELAKEKEAYYASLKESLKAEIISACNEQETECNDFKIQKIGRKGSIQYENIPELKNINLDIYRSDYTYSWTIKRARNEK